MTIGKIGHIVSIFVKDGSNYREIIGVTDYTATKRLNEMSQFSFNFLAINEDVKNAIIEKAHVFFMVGSILFLKGRIQKVTEASAYQVNVIGFGMEASLFDREFVKNDSSRVTYDTETNTNTIAKDILSTNADGLPPWDMDPIDVDTIATFGDIAIRFEASYKLNALNSLAKVIRQDWWVSHSTNPYDTDYFNIAERGTTPGYTFKYTGSGANCDLTDKQTDVSSTVNYIKFLGYGDGINQISTSCYNMSATYSTLALDITSTDLSITLADASSFPNSGTIRIMEEQILYDSKSGNVLTVNVNGRGYNSTTAREHKKGCFVEKHIPITNREEIVSLAESGSSIGNPRIGLQEHTETDRSFRDPPTMEILASNYLLDHKDPYVRIKLISNQPAHVLNSVDLGDTVAAQDTSSGLDGNYRVVSMAIYGGYGIYKLDVELSNKSLALLEQLRKIAELAKQEGQYMLGSTNIFQVGFAENCDPTYPFNLRFYMPDDVISINKVKLNFKMEHFRSYAKDVGVNTDSTLIVTSGNKGSTPSITTSFTNASIYSVGVSDVGEMTMVAISLYADDWDRDGVAWKFRVYDGTNYYPDSSGVLVGQTDYSTYSDSHSHGYSLSINFSTPTSSTAGGHNHGGYTGYSDPDYHRHPISLYPSHAHTVYHTHSADLDIASDSHSHKFVSLVHTIILIPGDTAGKTLTVQVKHGESGQTNDAVVNSEFTIFSKHTHNFDHKIYEDSTSLTGSTVQVKAGDDGSETIVATYTYGDDTTDIDITSNIPATEGWKNIKFTPSMIMRLDTSAYCKIFIESN